MRSNKRHISDLYWTCYSELSDPIGTESGSAEDSNVAGWRKPAQRRIYCRFSPEFLQMSLEMGIPVVQYTLLVLTGVFRSCEKILL